TQATTPPPEAEEAAQEFASTAASPDYEALLSLTSALVGVTLAVTDASTSWASGWTRTVKASSAPIDLPAHQSRQLQRRSI
ncbi:MAG: hypothetical protein ACXWC5_28455, partial [Burkholderiales bacterium]